MSPIAFAVCAVALWTSSCCGPAAAASATDTAATAVAQAPTLSEIAQFLEPIGQLLSADLFGTSEATDDQFEGRGKKKQKPMKMAMMMAGTAAGSMMMMKAMGAIKLFIIHSFFATKLGLIVAAYLLLCKMMEMKQMPKKTVKWVSPPSHFDEHPAPSMMSPYGDPQSYEPAPEQPQQAPAAQYGPPQPSAQYGAPPSDQYGPPQQQQHQFMPAGDFGGGAGGGDMQAHYSHVSPVTYRPMINRNQPDAVMKSGRMQ